MLLDLCWGITPGGAEEPLGGIGNLKGSVVYKSTILPQIISPVPLKNNLRNLFHKFSNILVMIFYDNRVIHFGYLFTF